MEYEELPVTLFNTILFSKYLLSFIHLTINGVWILDSMYHE